MLKSRLTWSYVAFASLFQLSTAFAQSQDGPVGPIQREFVPAFLFASASPNAVPQGANDWNCQPDEEHPRPLVLIHGTAENRYDEFAQLSPQLKAEGYCVFAPNLGGYEGTPFRAMTDIRASAEQLSAFIDEVLEATGASQVDIVGHSQGGMLPRYYAKYLDGATKINHLVALAPSNYGTNVFVVGAIAARLPITSDVLNLACFSCQQQIVGSQFLRDLNAGGDTLPGIRYTVIATAFDEIVTPFSNTFLRSAGVTNILLQAVCPLNLTDHFGITYDPLAIRLVKNALSPSTARPASCLAAERLL